MLSINLGPYIIYLRNKDQAVQTQIQAVYGDAVNRDVSKNTQQYRVSLESPALLRNLIRPQVNFFFDGDSPFHPLPKSQAYPLLEWGINWCIAGNDFSRLIIHSGVAVKNGKAIIFPADPGSGKSTLSALLALSGWHVYSDELAIIEFDSCQVNPIFRPICLKNNSIDIIGKQMHSGYMTPPVADTSKGTVAHAMLTKRDDFDSWQPAPIAAVVFPKYNPNTYLDIEPFDQLTGLAKLITNAFNFNVVGERGFECMGKIVKQAQLFAIQYGDFNEAESFLTELVT